MVPVIQSAAQAVLFVPKIMIQNIEKTDLFYNIGQAWCTRKAELEAKFFTVFDNKRVIFFTIDIVSLIATSTQVVMGLEDKYHWIERMSGQNDQAYGDNAFAIFFLACTVTLAASAVLVYAINRFSKPRQAPLEGATATWDRPTRESFKQVLYVARMIQNVAMAVFFSNKISFAISVVTQLYSLVKVTQRKWVQFKKEVSVNIAEPDRLRLVRVIADKIEITYTFLMRKKYSQNEQKSKVSKNQNAGESKTEELNAKEPKTEKAEAKKPKHLDSQDDDCPICLEGLEEGEEKPDILFCEQHTYHPICVLQAVNDKAKLFGHGFAFTKRDIIETAHSTNGIYTHSTYHAVYSVKVPETNKPHCLLCYGKPEHNDFTVSVHDLQYGWSSSKITWTKPPT